MPYTIFHDVYVLFLTSWNKLSFLLYENVTIYMHHMLKFFLPYNFRNVLLVNSSADHLKVGDFGLSKLIKVQSSHDVYKMTGETGSCEYS